MTQLEIAVPDVDITSFVLERVAAHADKPALIDGPSGRTITYGELARARRRLARRRCGARLRQGRRRRDLHAEPPEYAIAFHGAASAGGDVTTANPLYTANELGAPAAATPARGCCSPCRRSSRRAREARRGGPASTEIFVVGEAERRDAVRRAARATGDGARGRDRSRRRPRRPPLLERHDGAAQGRDADATATSSPTWPDPARRSRSSERRRPDRRACPFFHIYGMTVIMNLGLRSGATIVTMPRFDLEPVPRPDRGARGDDRAYVVPPIALALAKHPAVEGSDLSSLKTGHVRRRAARRGAGRAGRGAARLPRRSRATG